MSKLNDIKEKLSASYDEILTKIKESEAYQQLAAKWDELDGRTRFGIQLGFLGAFFLGIFITVLGSISSVNGLKRDIDDKEALIGYLQSSADEIKRLKALSQGQINAAASNSSLPTLAESVLRLANIEASHAEVGAERDGTEDKKSKEILLDVKFSQVNLRQLVKFMHHFADQGKSKSVYVKGFLIDTKEDPSGYMDATITIAGFIAKP